MTKRSAEPAPGGPPPGAAAALAPAGLAGSAGIHYTVRIALNH